MISGPQEIGRHNTTSTLPPLRAENGGRLGLGPGVAINRSSSASGHVWLVKVLVLAALVLCMTAPEELFYSQTESDLNPFAGTVKLALLGMGILILLLCQSRKRHWAIAGPFALLMGWAAICWMVSGAEVLPARNLISSFGGVLVLAAFCAAAEYIGGIQPVVRLLVWALLVTVGMSIFLGILGFQPMPGESRLVGELEWFHGVGLPWYTVAGCAALIAWVLASYLTRPGVWLEPAILLLLIIPALTFLRAFVIGIVVSILFAAMVAMWNARKGGRFPPSYPQRYKRLLLLATVTFAVGAVIFFMKTSIREEGNELSGREIIWPIEIVSVIQHPIFGLGPFGDIDLLRFKEDLPQVGAAHSDYLGAAVCYGIPGMALFVGTLFVTWRRIVRYAPVSVEERACRYAALFSLIGVSTTMIAENVIRDPRLFSLHLLFPALCLSAAGLHQKKAAV
jgi:O-antigen ligase